MLRSPVPRITCRHHHWRLPPLPHAIRRCAPRRSRLDGQFPLVATFLSQSFSLYKSKQTAYRPSACFVLPHYLCPPIRQMATMAGKGISDFWAAEGGPFGSRRYISPRPPLTASRTSDWPVAEWTDTQPVVGKAYICSQGCVWTPSEWQSGFGLGVSIVHCACSSDPKSRA